MEAAPDNDPAGGLAVCCEVRYEVSPELIAVSPADYFCRAVELGTSSAANAAARAAILQSCPALYSDRTVVRDLEDAGEQISRESRQKS